MEFIIILKWRVKTINLYRLAVTQTKWASLRNTQAKFTNKHIRVKLFSTNKFSLLIPLLLLSFNNSFLSTLAPISAKSDLRIWCTAKIWAKLISQISKLALLQSPEAARRTKQSLPSGNKKTQRPPVVNSVTSSQVSNTKT